MKIAINWQQLEDNSWSGFVGDTLVARLTKVDRYWSFRIVTPQDGGLSSDIECMESCEIQLNRFIGSLVGKG